MKRHFINTKYIWLLVGFLSVVACNDPEDVLAEFNALPAAPEELPALTAGSADFSNYVAVGASFTAGFTDGALFRASQENSFPSILAGEFAKVGGGMFTQPMMNDNFGGLALAGTRIQNPRLVFGGEGPVSLESLIGPVTVTTDIALNNPTGPFNNLGVPGAKSYHLVYNGFGNIANMPNAANPYFVRMTGATPDASMLELAMAQNPTFFTLSEIGGNDVLAYATSGGTGVDQTGNLDPTTYGNNDITDPNLFSSIFNDEVTALTSGGAKGLVTNVPYITDLPHFTTIPYNAIDPTDPEFAAQVNTLNTLFGALNDVFTALGAPERAIVFSETEPSALVIKDETLEDLSAQITFVLSNSPTFPAFIGQFGLPPEAAPVVAQLLGTMYGQARQANENDLMVLSGATVFGTVNTDSVQFLMSKGLSQEIAGQFSVEGITLPLADKWVLIPDEQAAIKTATDAYNSTIEGIASSNANVGLVDLKGILSQLASTGYAYGDYVLTSDLVTGGAVSLDGIHLTARGYALMAGAFLDAIDANFGSNFAASGNLPDASMYGTNYSPTLQ